MKGKAAYNCRRHNKYPGRSHRVASNSIQHARIAFRILCLDCVGLVIDGFRLFVKTIGMIDVGILISFNFV